MRLIICGSRDITNKKMVYWCIQQLKYPITSILCGTAKGPDSIGKDYGFEKHIPVEMYPADWSKGKYAGYERNVTMVNNCDAVLAIWDGKSKGTKHTIEYAKKMGKDVKVYIYDNY